MHIVFNGDCRDMLAELKRVPLIIADPPDNLGLSYDSYKDKRPAQDYYDWLELVCRDALRVADCFWLSYYWEHDLEVKYFIRKLLKYDRPSISAKTFIWRYTFGQYNDNDCGSGFRYLLRLMKPAARLNVDSIRVPSRRMELGDARASGPRVPDDVWEFSRVVGNANERRPWHPTQHPEDLIRQIMLLNSNKGDLVVDLFGGTGTTTRVAKQIERHSLISEISKNYAENIAIENNATHVGDPHYLREHLKLSSSLI